MGRGYQQKIIADRCDDVGELTDVIARVEWMVEFVLCEGGVEATVRTELGLTMLTQKILCRYRNDRIKFEFLFSKAGGDEFIKHLLELHSEPLAQKYEKDYQV